MPVASDIPLSFDLPSVLLTGMDRHNAPQMYRAVCVDDEGHIYVKQQPGTPQSVPVSAASADNTLVAAVPNKKIRVHQAVLQATASLVMRFESGTGGAALTGLMPIVAGAITAVLSGSNGFFVLPYSPIGWFETAAGQLLNLELSTSSVFGVLSYTEVD